MGIPVRTLLVASLVLSSIALDVAAKTLDPYKVSRERLREISRHVWLANAVLGFRYYFHCELVAQWAEVMRMDVYFVQFRG
jgi:hypothetical protein